MREKLASQVVQEIMLHAVGDKSKAIDAILALVDESTEKENHVMEHRFGNRVIKAMVKGDTAKEFNDKGNVYIYIYLLCMYKIGCNGF